MQGSATSKGVASRLVVRRGEPIPTSDAIAVEEPLEIRVEGRPIAVTMRTPGHDIDLAVGFLHTEGIIEEADDLTAIRHVDSPSDVRGNTVDCILASGVSAHQAAIDIASRNLYATSSCGICGKASIDRIRVQAKPIIPQAITGHVICELPGQLRAHQAAFTASGGLHAAALFSHAGDLLVVREDIGRHNAVDKVIGYALRQGHDIDLRHTVLTISGRAGFEIVQKAVVAGIPTIAAVGAASTLAIDLAAELGLTLIGFVREASFTRYTNFPALGPE